MNTTSEQGGGFVLLVALAILAGGLTQGMLTDTLERQMAVEEVSGRLSLITYTGRDSEGRATFDYGEGYE